MTQLRDMCTAEREQVRQTWLKLEWFCKKFTHKVGNPVVSEPKIIMYDQVPIKLNVTQAHITSVAQPNETDFDEHFKNLVKKSMSCK